MTMHNSPTGALLPKSGKPTLGAWWMTESDHKNEDNPNSTPSTLYHSPSIGTISSFQATVICTSHRDCLLSVVFFFVATTRRVHILNRYNSALSSQDPSAFPEFGLLHPAPEHSLHFVHLQPSHVLITSLSRSEMSHLLDKVVLKMLAILFGEYNKTNSKFLKSLISSSQSWQGPSGLDISAGSSKTACVFGPHGRYHSHRTESICQSGEADASYQREGCEHPTRRVSTEDKTLTQ